MHAKICGIRRDQKWTGIWFNFQNNDFATVLCNYADFSFIRENVWDRLWLWLWRNLVLNNSVVKNDGTSLRQMDNDEDKVMHKRTKKS